MNLLDETVALLRTTSRDSQALGRSKLRDIITARLFARGASLDDIEAVLCPDHIDDAAALLCSDGDFDIDYVPGKTTVAASHDFAELGGCPGAVPYGEPVYFTTASMRILSAAKRVKGA